MVGIADPSSTFDGSDRRVALVISRFNPEVTDLLKRGARAALEAAGVDDDDVIEVSVAGAFELAPACAQVLRRRPPVDAIVALGAVVRGETSHFDAIVQAASLGLQQLAVGIDIPLTFGVLTTETREQAIERADPERGDKGGDAVRAALEQRSVYDELAGVDRRVRGFQA